MLYQGIIGGGSSPVEPVDLSPVLLWTNPSPTADFAPQTVNLDLSKYAGVIVEFNSDSYGILSSRSYLKKNEVINTTYFGAGFAKDTDGGVGRRYTINDTGVTFEIGYYLNNSNNGVAIPTKIYGVKEYVVEPVGPLKTATKTYGVSVGTSLTDIGTTFDELSEIVGIVSYKSTDGIFINYSDNSQPLGLSFEGNKFIGYAKRDVGTHTNITVTVTGYKA